MVAVMVVMAVTAAIGNTAVVMGATEIEEADTQATEITWVAPLPLLQEHTMSCALEVSFKAAEVESPQSRE